MRCDLFFSPSELPDFYVKGRRVVLVDVLRACTSLAVALEAGAARIIPAESVEEAKQLVKALDREYTLLAGEMDGRKLPGFDLGNSPREFKDPSLAGKTIVFTSTNGARLMAQMVDAGEQVLLSFLNLSGAGSYLLGSGYASELTVVCAGQDGHFSLEDAVCAGMLCDWLLKRDPAVEFNDCGQAARILHRAHASDLPGLLRLCSHGVFLRENGMGEDLIEAARVDSVGLVPVVRDGRITAVRPPWGTVKAGAAEGAAGS